MTPRNLLGWCAFAAAVACAPSAPPAVTGSNLATQPKTASLDGVPVVYHVFGSGPVVIAHPGGPGGEWSYLRMPTLEKFATVVYIEPVGTGSSGRLSDPNGYTLETYVKGVEAVRAALGVPRFVLLGHSHGGFVAQAYALSHSEHLRGLILFDTSPVSGAELGKDIVSNLKWFENEPWFADASAAFAGFLAEKTDADATAGIKRAMPFQFADWTGRSKEFEPYRTAARVWIAPRMSRGPAHSEFGTDETAFDVRPRLHEITTPTLILVGAKDAICSQKMARMANEGIRGSRLVILPHSGHMGHIEEPAAHTAAIHEFLAALAN